MTAQTAAQQPKWGTPVLLSKGGHRIFRDENSGRWAIADNSGYFPELTDDGILWINKGLPIKLSLTHCTIPVIRERNPSKDTVTTEPLEAAWKLLVHVPGLKWSLTPEAVSAKNLFWQVSD